MHVLLSRTPPCTPVGSRNQRDGERETCRICERGRENGETTGTGTHTDTDTETRGRPGKRSAGMRVPAKSTRQNSVTDSSAYVPVSSSWVSDIMYVEVSFLFFFFLVCSMKENVLPHYASPPENACFSLFLFHREGREREKRAIDAHCVSFSSSKHFHFRSLPSALSFCLTPFFSPSLLQSADWLWTVRIVAADNSAKKAVMFFMMSKDRTAHDRERGFDSDVRQFNTGNWGKALQSCGHIPCDFDAPAFFLLTLWRLLPHFTRSPTLLIRMLGTWYDYQFTVRACSHDTSWPGCVIFFFVPVGYTTSVTDIYVTRYWVCGCGWKVRLGNNSPYQKLLQKKMYENTEGKGWLCVKSPEANEHIFSSITVFPLAVTNSLSPFRFLVHDFLLYSLGELLSSCMVGKGGCMKEHSLSLARQSCCSRIFTPGFSRPKLC